MALRTALFDEHQKLKAKIVDFAGWDMPLNYGSQIEEHNYVRNDAGMFDVSHMAAVDVKGERAKDFLRYMLANDVAKLKEPGKALYTCMCNEKGGIIDDLIVYFIEENFYRVVVNAGTRQKDLAWLRKHANEFNMEIIERTDLAIIAIQGPNARQKVDTVLTSHGKTAVENLKPFQVIRYEAWLIARTGYTGEDGYEIMLPAKEAAQFWQKLLAAGVKPCGLGARDTLRLEAGLNLYGNDMDETQNPLESNLTWTVAFEPKDRDFIGRAALEKAPVSMQLVGLVLEEKGVLRAHQKVLSQSQEIGEITSGSFSPTLGLSVAMARIPTKTSSPLTVNIREKLLPVKIIKLPFVRNGKKVYSELEA